MSTAPGSDGHRESTDSDGDSDGDPDGDPDGDSDGDEGVVPVPPVVEMPAVGHRQTRRVTQAHVVAVRIPLGGEVVEPHLRPPVVVGERHFGTFGTARARTLPSDGSRSPTHHLHAVTVDRRQTSTVDVAAVAPWQRAESSDDAVTGGSEVPALT